MDRLTPEQRHRNMKAVKNKDSEIELLLRKELWNRGLRYRKNVKGIFGRPDIVFVGKKLLCSAIVNFGMAMMGKTEKMILRPIAISGFQR